MPVGFGRAVGLPFPLRIGRKVALHFAPETWAETAVKTGFGLPPDITPGTVPGTVRTVVSTMSVLTNLTVPNAACFSRLGRSELA